MSETQNSTPSPEDPQTGIGASAPVDSPALGATPPAASTEERLRDAEERAQRSHEGLLRALADAENTRKRAQSEIASAQQFALETFARALLPVKDSLEAALATENTTIEALRSGVELTLKQLSSVLEKENVAEVNPVGEKFDPHRHQAISAVPSEQDPNTVISVLQKGYLLHDRVLRPALVMVSQGRAA